MRRSVAAALAFVALSACSTGHDAAVSETTATHSSQPTSNTAEPTAHGATPTIDGTPASSGATTGTGRPSITAPVSVATDDAGAPVGGAPAARLDATLDVAGFARQLSNAHATITDPSATRAERSAAGAEFQLVLRALSDQPELDEQVLGALGPAARPSIERIVRARQFLQARSAIKPGAPPPTEIPAWSIVEPEPVDTLLAHYGEAESITGIPWYWLAAIHLQETRMGRIRGVSSADAVGPMQFLPTTWASCCTGDPTVTRDAIIGAGTYLAQSGGPDDMAAALYQYNPNDGYVAVVTAYAESLRDEPELFPGFHGFQVFFGSSAGTIRLPIGHTQSAPIDAAAYLAAHPDDAA